MDSLDRSHRPGILGHLPELPPIEVLNLNARWLKRTHEDSTLEGSEFRLPEVRPCAKPLRGRNPIKATFPLLAAFIVDKELT